MKSGSCHCGAVQFTAVGEIKQALECNCSHCSRKSLLLWFVPPESFVITTGEEKLKTYTFNKHAIQHQFCSVCGCQAFGLGSMPDGTKTVAINIRCLDDIELADIKLVPINGRDLN